MMHRPSPSPDLSTAYRPISPALSGGGGGAKRGGWGCPALAATLLLATACAPAPTPPPRLTAATAVPAGAPTNSPPPVPTALGLTTVASLEVHLTASGIAWTFDGEKTVDWFETPARIYQIGDTAAGDTLEVHVHPSEDAARLAAGRVAPDGRTILDAAGNRIQVLWGGTPFFFQSGPLVVVYVGQNADIATSLQAAFGPPFAGG